jgi:uncharacterized cupin superfamily protein
VAHFNRIDDVPELTGSRYPAPHAEACAPTARRRLGLGVGLSCIGVTMTRIPPGARASQRHWHTHEDEFFLVLEGTPTWVDDSGARTLAPGDIVGAPAGEANAHRFENNSEADCVVLAIGNRSDQDVCTYPDIDMKTTTQRYRLDRSPWITLEGDPIP